jgi:ABC-type transport system involved in multi-copper enzyme maturation permease subunit
VITIIAGATFREAVRSRAFAGLLGLFVALVVLSRVVGWISGTDGNVITANLVMSLQSLIGVLVAVATGTALVQTEIQQRTLYTVLSRPVQRWQYVVGKFCGLAAALLAGQAAMVVIGMGYLGLTGAPLNRWMPLAGALTAIEVLTMAAVSLCLTSLTSPLLATALCLAAYGLGHAVGELPKLMYHLEGIQVTLCAALACAVPDLSRFTYRDQAVHGLPIEAGEFAQRVAYGLLWISLLVTITVSVIRRKQL